MHGLTRILLADDHPMMHNGIRTKLAADASLMVIGEATDGYEVRQLCQELQPDVILLDISMPGPSVFETIIFLRTHHPSVKLLVLTVYDDDAFVRGLTAAGIVGYLLKEDTPEVVARAIQVVVQGGTWFSRAVAQKLFHQEITTSAAPSPPTLTDREIAILRLVVVGKTNYEIADAVGISEKTVEKKLKSVFTKFGVATRVEAAVQAVVAGLVPWYPPSNAQERSKHTHD